MGPTTGGAFVTVGLVYEDCFSTVPDEIGKLMKQVDSWSGWL